MKHKAKIMYQYMLSSSKIAVEVLAHNKVVLSILDRVLVLKVPVTIRTTKDKEQAYLISQSSSARPYISHEAAD